MPSESSGFVRRLFRHPLLKLVSLFVAVVGWMYVQGGQVVEARIRAELVWSFPEGLVAVDPPPSTIAIVVEGARSATRQAQGMRFVIPVDLTQAVRGETRVDFAALPVEGLPKGVSLIGTAPAGAAVVLDLEQSRKVRVEPVVVGDPAEGYEVATTTVDPRVVEVRGARAAVAGLTFVRTKPIEATGLSAELDQPVELDLPPGIEVASGTSVRARLAVLPRYEQVTLSDVPISVYRGADAWRVADPSVQVVLRGPVASVRTLDHERVSAFVHLPDPATRPRYLASYGPEEGIRIDLVVPDRDIEVVSVRPSTVEVVKR